MTGTYEWNPMPHKVDIRCPSCKACASFEFAEVAMIRLKKDIEFFKESDLFEYHFFQDRNGQRWHGALYYPGLHGGGVTAIRDLPDGYEPENWAHSKYLYRSHGLDIGSVNCPKCHVMQKHDLDWPEDAYYSIVYKGRRLWTFHRESVVDLRDFIESSDRNPDDFKWSSFLLHVPTEFKQRKAREQIVKQLDRLIKGTKL